MILWFLAACAPPAGTAITVDVSLGDAVVFDPKLSGDVNVSWAVRGSASDCAVTRIHFENAHGQVEEWDPEVAIAWDGRVTDTGAAFLPGPYAAVVDVACADGATASGVANGWVVRAGLATVDFVDDGTDANAPLAFHRLDLLTRAVTPVTMPEYAVVTGVSPLDDAAGTPREVVPVWADAGAPPWGADAVDSVDRNLPVAYRAGASMAMVVRVGDTAVGEDGHTWPASGLPVRAAPVGWTRRDDGSFVSPPLAETLGVSDQPITWQFEAELDGVWVPVGGSVVTTHRVYRTLGPGQLRDGTSLGFAANLAWVAVLAELAPALEGVEATPTAVLDAVRAHIYENPWVIYDPSDTDYSGYEGEYIYWSYAWSELSDWLDRDEGLNLWCHSVSCLLSVLANHEGVYAAQEVIGVGFTTNLTRAAGSESWVTWGFNAHSVVSPDAGLTIWDAAVDLDGDDDPSAEPVTPVSPVHMDGAEYLWRLSNDPITIVNQGQCYFR